MPASTPRSPSSGGPRPTGPRRALRGDGAGVAEVIGYLLVFGILSLVLVMSMSAFGVAQEGAKERVVQLRAESAAARVAGVVVQASIVAEKQGTGSAVAYFIDLPGQLEGLDYTVTLEDKTVSRPDQVRIAVPGPSISLTSPVFAAGASSTVDLCPITVPGGPLYVRYGAPASGVHPVPAACSGGTSKIFLEVP